MAELKQAGTLLCAHGGVLSSAICDQHHKMLVVDEKAAGCSRGIMSQAIPSLAIYKRLHCKPHLHQSAPHDADYDAFIYNLIEHERAQVVKKIADLIGILPPPTR